MHRPTTERAFLQPETARWNESLSAYLGEEFLLGVTGAGQNDEPMGDDEMTETMGGPYQITGPADEFGGFGAGEDDQVGVENLSAFPEPMGDLVVKASQNADEDDADSLP